MATTPSLRYRRWSPAPFGETGPARPNRRPIAQGASRKSSTRRRPERQPPARPRRCHEACAELHRLARSSVLMRRHLLAIFGNVCWICWDEPGSYVDHVRPLWSLTPEERTQLRWWLPFNTQLACFACHRAKTAAEARERALLRRPLPIERRPLAC